MTSDTCPECGLLLHLRPFIEESRCHECSQQAAHEAYYRAVDEMYASNGPEEKIDHSQFLPDPPF